MAENKDLFEINPEQFNVAGRAVAERYRVIVENSNDGIIVFDVDSIICYANPMAALFLNIVVDDMIGRPLDSILSEENFRTIRDLAESCKGGQIKICSTIAIQASVKTPRHLEICISCDKRHDQELSVLYMSDRTELNQALYELRQRNVFFNNLIESSTDGIIAANMYGKIILFNKGANELLGYTKEEALTQVHVTQLYPEGQASEIMRKLRSEEFGGPGRCTRHRLIGLAKDGEKIPLSLSGAMIYNEEGEETATVGIFTDMRPLDQMNRELRKKEAELIQSERMASLGKLAAGVAHEINNPLTGILTFAEELLDESEQEDPKREDYKVIHRETLRCREIVRDLLDFAKQDRLEMHEVNINHIIMLTFGLVRRLASFQNIEITNTLEQQLLPVVGDPHQLQQVFLNLMVNASEAMSSGGELYIATKRINQGEQIDVTFSDTGDGIPPEVLTRIFEPFFSTKGGKTNGLGLAVSWGIIQQHGGRIEVDTAMGLGTTFHVVLPVATGRQADENE